MWKLAGGKRSLSLIRWLASARSVTQKPKDLLSRPDPLPEMPIPAEGKPAISGLLGLS
jgi:hypothetical protein